MYMSIFKDACSLVVVRQTIGNVTFIWLSSIGLLKNIDRAQPCCSKIETVLNRVSPIKNPSPSSWKCPLFLYHHVITIINFSIIFIFYFRGVKNTGYFKEEILEHVKVHGPKYVFCIFFNYVISRMILIVWHTYQYF